MLIIHKKTICIREYAFCLFVCFVVVVVVVVVVS